jgi:ribonuclease VapC
MFIDASALVAILAREPDGADLEDRLERHAERHTSAIAILEATLALPRELGLQPSASKAYLDRFLEISRVHVMSVGAREADLAGLAHGRFGKGRHRARLNMGDCLAYACARSLGEPLLHKGDDFSQTDFEIA